VGQNFSQPKFEAYRMKVLPLSEVKMKLSQLVEEVASLDEEITITRNGKPVAIIVSPDEFDSWKETLAIRADAELMAEIRRGLEDIKKKRKLYTLEELFTE
jgi:antitoxin YefM